VRTRVSSLVGAILALVLVGPPASTVAQTTDDQAWQLAGATLCLQSMVRGLPGGLLGVGAAIASNPSCALTVWNGATQLDAILQECVFTETPNDACSHLDLSPLDGIIGQVRAAEPTPAVTMPTARAYVESLMSRSVKDLDSGGGPWPMR
jgi:hypothetical protein